MAAFDTINERKRAFDYGFPFWAYPWPEGDLSSNDRSHIWGGFYAGGVPAADNPYYIADHVAEALARLIEQFKQSENLKTVIELLVERSQGIEDETNKFILYRLIATAEGDQLDGVGEIVGEDRQNRADGEYRDAIIFRIFTNISKGAPETLIQIVDTITAAGQVRYYELWPARVLLYTDGSVLPTHLKSNVEASAPAGVGVDITMGFGTLNPFEFADEGGQGYDEGDGFSETNYLEGGQPIGGEFVENIS